MPLSNRFPEGIAFFLRPQLQIFADDFPVVVPVIYKNFGTSGNVFLRLNISLLSVGDVGTIAAIQKLHAGYAEQANFIHVEIYQFPFDQQKVAKAVDEWHLPSDPWTFIVDKTGIVRDRFEGAAPIEELEPSIKTVLG